MSILLFIAMYMHFVIYMVIRSKHLEFLLSSVEPSQPSHVCWWPWGTTHHVCLFAVIGPFSSSYSSSTESKGVLYLSCWMYFFFKIYSIGSLLFDNAVLDFLHFIQCFKRIFLISVWLILSIVFRSCIRKPASTRVHVMTIK